MKFTRLLCCGLLHLLGVCVGTAQGAALARPNILWLVAEDFSPHLGCYGEKHVSTPNLDRLAKEGVRYTRAYTTAPVCSASRSAFMTGMYQTTIGAHNHRTANKSPLPEGVRTLPQWMQEAGYFTANIAKLPEGFGFKGTGKTDWNFTIEGKAFQSSDWTDLKTHQPFCAQINFSETHRAFRAPPHADPAKVEIPPYYPDHPVTRKDWAGYLDEATALDVKVGKILDQLAKDGLADNTVIIFSGDHGQAHVRGKQFCYEEGLRVPLIIRWPKSIPTPKQIQPGLVDARFIEAIDLAPTMLALAGAPKPARMQGRIFLGDRAEPAREMVFGARDRCDETAMRLRTVRDDRHRYIRSFTPEVPLLATNAYKARQYPVWNLLLELHAAGKLTPPQAFLCEPRMPEEQLYDLQTDPWQIQNLADSKKPEDLAALTRLRAALEKWIVDTDDKGRLPDPDAGLPAEITPRPRRANQPTK